MKVHGVELPEERLNAALLAMPGFFKARDVESRFATVLKDHDFGRQHRGSTIMRAADRLLQRARRAGTIRFAHGYWQVNASAIEARSDETSSGSAEGESAVPKADAPTTPQSVSPEITNGG